MTPAPVTLAMLRKAAPKGWTVKESGPWVLTLDSTNIIVIDVRNDDPEARRRAALAALKALKKEKP